MEARICVPDLGTSTTLPAPLPGTSERMYPGPHLPCVVEFSLAPWPELPRGGAAVEFRLVYDGWLPPESRADPRSKEKHDIRRKLSGQLRMLRETHPRLTRDTKEKGQSSTAWVQGMGQLMEGDNQSTYYIHRLPTEFRRMDRTFIPLINELDGVGCSLEILFLRRDPPGALIRSGGDIDNRIKVLFDALRMPRYDTEVHGDLAGDPDPFYCLLEDDRLITEVKVTTDRLLVPKTDPAHDHDRHVHLIIHVKTIVLDPGNLGALSF
jgi:hypothetical protein